MSIKPESSSVIEPQTVPAKTALPTQPTYRVKRVTNAPPLDLKSWDDPAWDGAQVADVAIFTPSSTHKPRTQAKLVHDSQTIHVLFRVHDRFVMTTHVEYHDHVCRDACVEFFVLPNEGGQYFNFEINCGGVPLLHAVPSIKSPSEKKYIHRKVDVKWFDKLDIHHSQPRVIKHEISDPVTWSVGFRIPIEVFREYGEPIGELSGSTWRCNFYKCASDNSHPHWASWAPIGEPLSFHKPDKFAPITFE